MKILKFLSLAILVMGLSACGGGGGGNDDDEDPITLLAVGLAGLDGSIIGEVGTGGNSVIPAPPGTFLAAGEFDDGASLANLWKALVSFDLSALPNGADVQSATINVRVNDSIGDNVPLYQGLIMEHVTLGGTLDVADFDSAPIGGTPIGGTGNSSTRLVEKEDTAPGYKSADVTNAVRIDVAASRNVTSIRLRMAVLGTDTDGAADLLRMFSFDPSDTANAVRPFLRITYTLPTTE